MNVKDLLTEALEAGLTVTTDGSLLVVRGFPGAERLARQILACKPEVLATLAEGRQLLGELSAGGYTLRPVGRLGLRVTPPLPAERHAAVAGAKMALLALLHAEVPGSELEFEELGQADAPAVPQKKGEKVGGSSTAVATNEEVGGGHPGQVSSWTPGFTLPIDWKQEHNLERDLWQRRLTVAVPAARPVIERLLREREPNSEQEWLAQGTRWVQAEHELRQQGLLVEAPPSRPPAGSAGSQATPQVLPMVPDRLPAFAAAGY